MKATKTSAVALLTVGLTLAPLSATAAPFAKQQATSAASPADVTPVRFRGHRGWHRWHHHHHHRGAGAAIGIGLGILGGILATEAAHGYYYADDARSRCAATFRSFEWDTGLYTTYEGEKRLCPYLR
jgi:hypothetical protein